MASRGGKPRNVVENKPGSLVEQVSAVVVAERRSRARRALDFCFFCCGVGWSYVRLWAHVVWVCRISFMSVLIGLVLMLVSQVQDAFAETNFGFMSRIVFFASSIFFWILPVYFSARLILMTQSWIYDPLLKTSISKLEEDALRASYRWPIFFVPKILALTCFFVIGLGLHYAQLNLVYFSKEGLPANLELFNKAYHEIRTLYYWNFLFCLLFFIILFAPGIKTTFKFLGRKIFDNKIFRRVRLLRFFAVIDRLAQQENSLVTAVSRRVYALYGKIFIFILLPYMIILALALGYMLVSPLQLTEYFSRATLFMFLLGSPVFILTFFAWASHKIRAPLVTLTVIAVIGLANFFGDEIDKIRTGGQLAALAPEAQGRRETPDRQILFNQAVARWREANECPVNARPRRTCPSPIIIAAQGGGSRAAFFTASVIGKLLDDFPQTRDDRVGFRKLLFALSTVSGSSVTAAVVRAALEDGETSNRNSEAFGKPPCKDENIRTERQLWFGGVEGKRDIPSSWRSCLQLIVSGDFLSPSLIGLAFRDNLLFPLMTESLSGYLVDGNRSVLLERALERRYQNIVQIQGPYSSLARRLGYWGRRPQRAADWTPLLFLNATSVNTGRRIVMSDVRPWTCVEGATPPRPRLLYPQAYDFFELIESRTSIETRADCGRNQNAAEEAEAGRNIRLSTAAVLSARFPLISGSGALWNRAGPLDYVVDGGYFENDGLATARDLSVALRLEGLDPIVVHITNSPVACPISELASQKPECATNKDRPPLPQQRERSSDFLIALTSPFTSLYNIRLGHGAEAAYNAYECIRARNFKNYIHFAVYDALEQSNDYVAPYLKDIPLSWWLSQPMQKYLDEQLSRNENREAMKLMEAHIRDKIRLRLPKVDYVNVCY